MTLPLTIMQKTPGAFLNVGKLLAGSKPKRSAAKSFIPIKPLSEDKHMFVPIRISRTSGGKGLASESLLVEITFKSDPRDNITKAKLKFAQHDEQSRADLLLMACFITVCEIVKLNPTEASR